MSEPIRRKNSSRQLLENLIRVTAQRSQEDAEEVERERRRRSRERDRREDSGLQDNRTEDRQPEEELKPSSSSSSSSSSALEEDEGFGDWSHRAENRGESEEWRSRRGRVQTSPTLQQKSGQEEQQEDDEEEEEVCKLQQASRRTPEVSSNKAKVLHSSAMFLPHEAELQPSTGQPAHRSSDLVTGTMDSRGACSVDDQEQRREEPRVPQTRWRSEGPLRDDEEDEELILNELAAESEEGGEADRRSAGSSRDEEAMCCYGPMSPTFKKLLIQFYPDETTSRVSTDGKCTIIERTESLKKSTNSVKRTSLPVTVSKINRKLEMYTQALEISSKENRSGTPSLTDLTAASEPVSSKKSLFEGGEAWNQNVPSVTPSKDADGLKVGVADLINQWVRGSEHGSRCSSPFTPAEGSTCKRYRFVVTGHGKYEKVPIEGYEDTNSPSAQQFYEDL
ncbi:lymphocyte-specific protein 1 [Takifugu rubripes]|uniref:Lymphocyte specific protein 1 a n=1 Tax=Takifugu rubripes TaxID=31033 RepID=A0A674N638_TAKRU|nr:lymphocyte-specific protein 1 [Takifugu rubripes]